MTNKKSNLNYQSNKNKKYSGKYLLFSIEDSLINLNKDIIKKLSKNLGEKKIVLDFGAGIGSLANIWYSENKIKPDCLEIDSELRKVLIKRNFICYTSIKSLNKYYDVIYTSNVLEHIKDDLGAIKELNSRLKKNGYLCIFVPAFNFLYSDLDKKIGHYRRYDKKSMIKKLKLADFNIKESYYFDSLGFFIWWLFIKLFKFQLTMNSSSNNHLLFYDKFILPISSFLDRLGFKFVLGKNLIVIAQKNNVQ